MTCKTLLLLMAIMICMAGLQVSFLARPSVQLDCALCMDRCAQDGLSPALENWIDSAMVTSGKWPQLLASKVTMNIDGVEVTTADCGAPMPLVECYNQLLNAPASNEYIDRFLYYASIDD